MVGEDLLLMERLGIGAVAMYIFYKFATTVTNNAAKQMLQLHSDFLIAYKENTKALMEFTKSLTELVACFKEHTSSKDAAIKLLQDKFDKSEEEWKKTVFNRKS